ncbi:MAG: hypothetical protein FWG63_03195 [Defluviitaleaceae bacterium]|nr:hypothetical protein [Defluviitaleaceae bacterium]
MIKTLDVRNPSELRKAELAGFTRELGVEDIDSIERSKPDNGECRIKDYTAERGNWLDNIDFDEFLAECKELDNQRKQKASQA